MNTSFIISRSILLRIRNVSDKSCTENQHTFHVRYPCFKNCDFYEIMWKNTVELGRSQMIVWCTLISCWIPKAKNTHSEYVILTDFPKQKWLLERASVLLYMHIACLLSYGISFSFYAFYLRPIFRNVTGLETRPTYS